MLHVTQAQMDMFAAHGDRRFVLKIARYLADIAKQQAQQVAQEILEKDAEYLVDRAKSYGYRNYQDVYYFIELVLVCGDDFEQNPQHQWLVEQLSRNCPARRVPVKPLYEVVWYCKSNREAGL